jgi:hypothetical protein
MNVILLRNEKFWLWTNRCQPDESIDVEMDTGVDVVVECGDSYLLRHARSGFFKWLEKRFTKLASPS